jgi:hypothetical protein
LNRFLGPVDDNVTAQSTLQCTKYKVHRVCIECVIGLGTQKKPILFKVTESSSIPYRTHSAYAKMASYPDPPPVIPVPDTIVTQADYAETLLPGSVQGHCRPEMFPGIGALPEPPTESHVVNRGTPVAPCLVKTQRKRVTRVGRPCSPGFPNIMSCLRSPITANPRVTH